MTDFDAWLAGVPVLEEPHYFVPVGQQSNELTALMNERAALVETKADEEEHPVDKAVGESYVDRMNELDEKIAELTARDHPDAPVILLRAISDEDVTETVSEVRELVASGDVVTNEEFNAEAAIRQLARAAVKPAMTTDQARLLRRKLNAGEWARLVRHVSALCSSAAEETSLPNS